MCALHSDAFRELPNLAIAQRQLLLQVRTLKLLACLANRKCQEVLIDQRLVDRRCRTDLNLNLFESDIVVAAQQQ